MKKIELGKPMMMFDIETLSTEDNALVYEVGAVGFSLHRKGVRELLTQDHWFLDPVSQMAIPRHASRPTLDWMVKTPGRMEALTHAFEMGISMEEFYPAFRHRANQAHLFWCWGTHFDKTILDSLFRSFGYNPPWAYDQVLDVRTVCRALELKTGQDHEPDNSHDAVQDCLDQIEVLRKFVEVLG